jgi:hypothetical protein
MTDREELAQVDRLIDECKDHILRQAEVVTHALQKGHDTGSYIDAASLGGAPQRP